MNAEPSLRLELFNYDNKLRIRWGRHSEKFIIERYQPCTDPRLANATPPPDGASPIRHDLWEGWREGYVHVLTVPKESAHWNLIAPYLAKTDAWRQGGMKAINDQLDREAEAAEAAQDKNIDNVVENLTDDAYEHMAWFTGRRQAVTTPEPPLVDTGLGFKMRDRRHGE